MKHPMIWMIGLQKGLSHVNRVPGGTVISFAFTAIDFGAYDYAPVKTSFKFSRLNYHHLQLFLVCICYFCISSKGVFKISWISQCIVFTWFRVIFFTWSLSVKMNAQRILDDPRTLPKNWWLGLIPRMIIFWNTFHKNVHLRHKIEMRENRNEVGKEICSATDTFQVTWKNS